MLVRKEGDILIPVKFQSLVTIGNALLVLGRREVGVACSLA
jgi:hypothetical protein